MKRIVATLTPDRRHALLVLLPARDWGWFYASYLGASKHELYALEDEGLLESHAEHGGATVAFRRRKA